MGIFIHLSISKSVTQEQWEKVYNETLRFLDIFPFAEGQIAPIKGIDVYCLVRTQERQTPGSWFDPKPRIGWKTCGDYQNMAMAEDFYLPRNLVGEDMFMPEADDPLPFACLGVFGDYMHSPLSDRAYHLWGDKTQGEPYHLLVLAIGCLIQARLGDRAVIYGDITAGQCRRAVEMINEHLDTPIEVPDRCDMERLFCRVTRLDESDQIRLAAFVDLYLGEKSAAFGEYLRTVFTKDTCEAYWRERFKENTIGTGGFSQCMKEYLLWGFDLETLCRVVNFTDRNGIEQYEMFVKAVLDTEIYVSDKDCSDVLEIDPQREQPYGVATLFARFFFAGARNKKVDAYIPLEIVHRDLCHGLEGKCDAAAIIHKYFQDMQERQEELKKKGQDGSETEAMDDPQSLNQLINKEMEQYERDHEKYDIADRHAFMNYSHGNTILPSLKEYMGKSYNFCKSLLEEDQFKELMAESPHSRCEWLAKTNRSIFLRDKDWEKIFSDIESNESAFSRYYPAMRINITADVQMNLLKAMLLNDDFYACCQELGNSMATE